MGLRSDEFWTMTPYELRLAFDAYRHQQERADFRAGIVAATIANVNRDPKKRKRPYRPQDFLPRYGRSVQTPEQQLRVIELLNAALGGEDRRARPSGAPQAGAG